MRRPASVHLRLHAALLLGGCLLASACGGSAAGAAKLRASSVARAGDASLDGATLERWLLGAPLPPSPGVASAFLASWINSTLMIDALRTGRPLDDSVTTDAVIAFDAAHGVELQYFRDRLAKRPPVTDAEGDSLANTDNVRVFQQILLHYPPTLDSASAVAMGTRARALISRARNGTSFTTLVKEASEDTAARSTSGFLPALSRAELQPLPERLRAIWQLQPDEIGPVIPTPAGLHVVRRATREESRSALKAWLRPVLARHADSLFIDSISRARHPVIAANARARVRALATEPGTVTDTSALATWQGGALSPHAVRIALLIGSPGIRAAMENASDSLITSFVTELVHRQILLGVITSAPMPTAEARAALAPAYRNALAPIRAELSRYPANQPAGTVAIQYLDSVFAKKNPARYYLLPGALSAVLRDRSHVSVDTIAVRKLVELAQPAWRIAHANDSTQAQRQQAASRAVPPAPPKPAS